MIPTTSKPSLKRTRGESPTPSRKRTHRTLLPRPAASPVTSPINAEQTTLGVDSSNIDMVSTVGERSGDATAEGNTAAVQSPGEDDQSPDDTTASARGMAGIGGVAILSQGIGSFGAGHAYARQVRRQLSIAGDDYPVLFGNHAGFVNYLYGGITSVPAEMDEKQTKMVEFFNKKLKTFGRAAADLCLANMASMIVADIIKLHRDGDCLLDFQFEALHPTDDDLTMKAGERFTAICGILHKFKKHVVDLINGGDYAVTKFMAAPMGHSKRKAGYVNNNKARSDNLKELQKLKASIEKDQGGAESGADDDGEEALSIHLLSEQISEAVSSILAPTADEKQTS
jgi:hypothetical protein